MVSPTVKLAMSSARAASSTSVKPLESESVESLPWMAKVKGLEPVTLVAKETVAERVRRRIERMPVAIGPGEQITVTVSIGGAFAPQWVRSTPALWQERADQQLYRAKAQGRNLVRLEPTAVSVVSNEEKRLLFETFQFQDHE